MRKDLKFHLILAISLSLACFFAPQLIFLPAAAHADEAAPQQWTVDWIQQRALEVEASLKSARRAVSAETAGRLGVDVEDLEMRVRKWVELDALFDGLQSEMQKRAELQKETAAVQEELNAFQQRGLLKKPPYALSTYDALLIDYDSLQQRMETSVMSLKAAQRSLDESRARLSSAQDQLQDMKETQTVKESASALWTRAGFQLDFQLADTMFHLHGARADNLQQQKQLNAKRAELVRSQVDVVRLGLAYDDKDLDDQIRALEQKKKNLGNELDLLQKKKKETDRQWLKIRDQIQKSVYTDDLTRMEDQLKGLDQWRETYQEAIDQHEEMMRLADQQQQAWRRRYDLLRQVPDRDVLLQWYELSQQRQAHINRVLPIEQQRQNSLWQQFNRLEGATDTVGKPVARNGNGGFAKALHQMAAYRLDYLSMLVASRGIETRLKNEIDVHLERKPLAYQAERIWARFRSIWNYQVWMIDDRPLTVQKILVALVILLAGIMATKIVIHRIAKRVLTRPQIKATTAATIEKLLLYLGYLLVVLLALRMVNIPLAAFAFLGGAVAIGVGFGAQNLINNFISGFIIMGEQPINIGDLIEVEGVLGQVEEIGARCTRIRTGENIHILVPNSSFLEKNITNWTLSDRQIRADVTVGVAYGSAVEQVEKLLLQACDEFNAIRKNPEPFVLFTDFGDNALVFKVLFWINVQRVIERRLIESQLRFRIDDLFHKSEIVIAFPQRDVHLDSSSPLSIRLLERAKDSGNSGTPA